MAVAEERAEDPTWVRLRRAAVELFAMRGFNATGIRDIAKATEISSATLYHYMQSKESLLTDIMRESLSNNIRAAEEVQAEHSDPAAALEGLVRAHVVVHGQDRLMVIVVDNEIRSLHGDNRAEIIGLRDRYESIWTEVLEQGIESGAFQLDDLRFARLAILAMASGVANWYSPDGPYSLEQIADAYAGLALRLVTAPTERHVEPVGRTGRRSGNGSKSRSRTLDVG